MPRPRPRSRDQDYEEDYEEERPRYSGRRSNSQMLLWVCSGGVLVLLVAAGLILVPMTQKKREQAAKATERERQEALEEQERKVAELEAKSKAKLEREMPWKKALEKILPTMKRHLNTDNKMKRYFGVYGFEDKKNPMAPIYRFTMRPPFFDEDRETQEKILLEIIMYLEELEKSFFTAREGTIKFNFFKSDAPEDEEEESKPEAKEAKAAVSKKPKHIIAESEGRNISWK